MLNTTLLYDVKRGGQTNGRYELEIRASHEFNIKMKKMIIAVMYAIKEIAIKPEKKNEGFRRDLNSSASRCKCDALTT